MPRRNRSANDVALPLRLTGSAATEQRRGRAWTVQPIPAAGAVKVYRCPGCERDIPAGVAHVVVWRADGVLGDAADVAARRHWHLACWRAA
ncbi:hypothetical protein [uncultured Amnibacterium sp.]|uniref:hypothetical protein n=1 Tax=uncultured Amnibacterium sp. TaxID=1631851 RepID=UPI0035CA2F6B